MIRSLHIRGLGPHLDTRIDFDPKGVTEITGRSEAGKTTLEDAICFVLWGCDRTGKPLHRRALNDEGGPDEVRVEMTLASGSTLVRALRFDDKDNRKTLRKYKHHEYPTEKAWQGALGALGRNSEGLRLALVPCSWVPLAQGEGGGRPLRDALASLLPPVDRLAVVRELMAEAGFELRHGDPVHDRDAEDLRTRAKRDRDRAAGSVEHGRSLLAQGKAIEPPTVADVGAARGVLEMAETWKRYATDRANHELHVARVLEQQDRTAEWDKRRAELGDRPATEVDQAAVDKAEQDLAEALEKSRRLAGERGSVQGDRNRVAFDLAKLQEDEWHPGREFTDAINRAARAVSDASKLASDAPEHCPTCHQVWKAAAQELQRQLDEARKAKAEAEAAYEEEAEARAEDRKAAIEKAEGELEELDGKLAELDEAIEAHAEVVKAATQKRDDLRNRARPAEEWDRALRLLGECPVPLEAKPEPKRPTFDRPTEDQVEDARAKIAAADEAAGARKERARLLKEGTRLLETAEADLERAQAEVDRMEALVAAVRAAPTEGLRRSAAGVLGNLGPVSLEFSDSGGCEVLVDGRPWHLASDGRQIVADVWLRAAIRRALGVSWLPLVIDRVQDVAGQTVPTPAPAIVLRTVAGQLRSSAELVGAA